MHLNISLQKDHVLLVKRHVNEKEQPRRVIIHISSSSNSIKHSLQLCHRETKANSAEQTAGVLAMAPYKTQISDRKNRP